MRITGSCIENLKFALGRCREIIMCRVCERALGALGRGRSIASNSGRCRGSRSTEGDVTTELAKRMLAFLSSALLSSVSSTVLEGFVVLFFVVVFGLFLCC